MLLNRLEYAAMNNPIRAWVQRRFEAGRLLALGGPMRGGRALEIGCGRGIGVEIILDRFGAGRVDAFDLDARMVRLARRRTARRGARASIWRGDAEAIAAADGLYDAVFDFGILHHLPDWRRGLREIRRVLRPGGRLYAEEVLAPLLRRFPWRRLFRHPAEDRFDARGFAAALGDSGFRLVATAEWRGRFGWFVADAAPAE